MDLLFELSVEVAPKGSRAIAATLYRQLRSAILDGRLPPGARMPSTRMAPGLYRVSRNTAQDVYERLAEEGLVRMRHGSGTYVGTGITPRGGCDIDVQLTSQERVGPFWSRDDIAAWMGYWQDTAEAEPSNVGSIDLRPCLVDPGLFPHAVFRQAMARQLRRLEIKPPSFNGPFGNPGNYRLRLAIAEHLGLTRAIACNADDVLVTSGAQQAFDLVARTMVKPGETVVAVEDPGYPPMRVPFAAAGARIVPVRVDSEGIVVDEIPPGAGIICVCPSHQFPLGMSMSPARRKALIRFAKHHGAAIVEDDYDGEFRYDGAPLEALRSSPADDLVFYVGSFSKCMFPSVRLGFMIAPRWATPALVTAKNSLDWHCSIPIQAAVASFMIDGHLAKHVRRVRKLYRGRRDFLIEALRSKLGHRADIVFPHYGMHLALLVDPQTDCAQVCQALLRRGIKIHSLDRYHLGPALQRGLIISYAAAEPKELAQAAAALAEELALHDDENTARINGRSLVRV